MGPPIVMPFVQDGVFLLSLWNGQSAVQLPNPFRSFLIEIEKTPKSLCVATPRSPRATGSSGSVDGGEEPLVVLLLLVLELLELLLELELEVLFRLVCGADGAIGVVCSGLDGCGDGGAGSGSGGVEGASG